MWTYLVDDMIPEKALIRLSEPLPLILTFFTPESGTRLGIPDRELALLDVHACKDAEFEGCAEDTRRGKM